MNDAWQKFYDKATDWVIQSGPRILLAIVALFAGLWIIRFLNRSVTVAAGLALSGTLQNFTNGILLLIQHPFRVGDNIRISNRQ
jgi:small conductance mechanosensitive channel